jgi:hypothetical protein
MHAEGNGVVLRLRVGTGRLRGADSTYPFLGDVIIARAPNVKWTFFRRAEGRAVVARRRRHSRWTPFVTTHPTCYARLEDIEKLLRLVDDSRV